MTGPLGLLRRQVHAHVAIGERHHLEPGARDGSVRGAGQQLLEGKWLAQIVVGSRRRVPRTRSLTASRTVRKSTGVVPLSRRWPLRTARPSRPGSHQSRMTRSHSPSRSACWADVAIGGVRDGEALVRQPVDDRSREARVVLDQQDTLSHDPLRVSIAAR